MCLNKCFSAQHAMVFLVSYLQSAFSIKSLVWTRCSGLFSSLCSLSCLLSGSKSGSIRWPLSRGRQRRCSFCFPFHSVPYLLSIEEMHQSLPMNKQHKQIYSPERDCSCWNLVSLTTLDQRQSASIVYVGSKIKTSKNCKNNKQKAPNKWTDLPPWANKCSETQLLRRSSLWIQCSGVTGNLNCCVNIHALWQLCYPGIWQLSEPGMSLTHCCHKSASKQSHHMFMQRDKLLSLGSSAWGWNIEHSSNKCNIKPGSLPSSSIKLTSF